MKIYKEYYECGDGWRSLINKAKRILRKYNLKHKHDKNFEELKFMQVKEKFALLTIYTNYYVPRVQNALRKLEWESSKVCEICGSRKNAQHYTVHGWEMIRCPKCLKEEEEKYKEFYYVGSKES